MFWMMVALHMKALHKGQRLFRSAQQAVVQHSVRRAPGGRGAHGGVCMA
jgi:hypothetical protein